MNLRQMVLAFFPFILFTLNLQAQTVAVNGNTVYQTMDGFGGENGGPWAYAIGNTMTAAQANLLFSTTPGTGIGISLYRTDSVDGTSSTAFPDIQAMQAAVAQGASVELAMQSPPSSMKYSGNYGDGTAGASGSCLSASYSTYAAYIVGVVQNLQSNGVPVAALDVQNEPNEVGGNTTPPNGFGSCIWTGATLDAFVKVLGPALSSAGLSPKVMLGSAFSYANSENYFGPCVSDPSCDQYVSIVSGHGYGYPDTPVLYTASGKHFWLSETGDGSTPFDPNMDSAVTMAQNIAAFLSIAQVSTYEWWELAYPNTGNCANCSLVDQNFNTTKRYYAFGNFSLFVRPGWVEIGATYQPQSGVQVTAFENESTGAFAIVVVNGNGGSVSQQFTLTGLSASSVTPYVTDPNNNLAPQTAITITSNAFTATLTATSVTTFVGGGHPTPGVPTGLSASTVQ